MEWIIPLTVHAFTRNPKGKSGLRGSFICKSPLYCGCCFWKCSWSLQTGNVELTPIILKNSQEYVKDKHGLSGKPIDFVFHGGSGSSREQIREAIDIWCCKNNLDTDMQWAFWDGVHGYYKENKDYLQAQLNPEGDDKPNKKYYDPRVWLRSGENYFVERLKTSFEDLNCINRN